MDIKIIETQEIKTLTILDPKTETDYAADLIGNHDGFSGDDDGLNTMTQDNYEWWAKLLTEYQAADYKLHEYRSEVVDQGSLDQCLNDASGVDLEQHPCSVLAAIDLHRVMNGEVTDVQLFGCGDSFSANFAINNEFMIQLGTDGEWSIPSSNEASWSDEDKQDYAAESYTAQGVADNLGLPTELDEIKEQFAPAWY
jgi:hypothetical protein